MLTFEPTARLPNPSEDAQTRSQPRDLRVLFVEGASCSPIIASSRSLNLPPPIYLHSGSPTRGQPLDSLFVSLVSHSRLRAVAIRELLERNCSQGAPSQGLNAAYLPPPFSMTYVFAASLHLTPSFFPLSFAPLCANLLRDACRVHFPFDRSALIPFNFFPLRFRVSGAGADANALVSVPPFLYPFSSSNKSIIQLFRTHLIYPH
jgi:hypothetical protein